MKNFISIFLLLIISVYPAVSQDFKINKSFSSPGKAFKPISWSKDQSLNEVKVGETIELIFKAKIDKDWYLYSSDFDPDLGPIVTEFTFEENDSFHLVDTLRAINPKKKYDEIWEGEYTYFKKEGEFRQTVRVLKPNPVIKTTASYQVCSDIDGKCIPFEDDFNFSEISTINNPSFNLEAYLKKKKEEELKKAQLEKDKNKSKENKSVKPEVLKATYSASTEEVSIGWFMILAFFGGLTAIFTPCVFPMIPMTVSFFTKNDGQNAKHKLQAIFYGFSIVAIYSFIGAVFTPLAGPDAANLFSTHWLPNLIFFAVFIFFALSFFGMFEIVLPSKWVNAADKQADKGGWIGVFFMAFTLAVVSFSCTGPIVGTILAQSAGGEFIRPTAGMFAFGMAFALPFSTFAFFPSLMNKLPKSGGWLNSVKVTLGFIELALAFKFLSVADQVYHWGILDRHVNIAIWVAIASFMTLYYLGKIKLPHDSAVDSISVPRMLLAIICFSFVVYMTPGMFGAPLKALSGFLPPQTSNDNNYFAAIRENGVLANETNGNPEPVKHTDILHMPHGIKGYFDYNEGLAAAKKTGKPIFIDFTGHGCVNCRKMEDNVWGEKEVLKRLKKDYIVIALYVDERKELPESEWVTSTNDGKIKKTVGKVNHDFQWSKFKANAQPFYVLLDHNENLLGKPRAYDLDVNGFVTFLDGGIEEFKKR